MALKFYSRCLKIVSLWLPPFNLISISTRVFLWGAAPVVWLWVWSNHGQELPSAPQGCSAPFTVEHWGNLLGWSQGFFPKPPNQKLLQFIHSFIILAINSPYEQKINRASKHFQGIIGCHPIITQRDWTSGFEITRRVAFFYWDGSSKHEYPWKAC